MSVRRDHLHDQVTRAIALRILRNTLTDEGETTTEGQLCKELGVSRTVVRSAVKVLVAKGLLDVRAKTGMRVRPRSDWNLLDPALLMWQAEVGVDDEFVRNLCRVRLIIEPPTAAAATVEATADERAAIQEAYLQMAQDADDFATFVAGDTAFHHAIARATHNDLLILVNRLLLDALRGTQRLHRDAHGHAKAIAALDLHRDVADAIVRCDPQAAHDAMVRVIKRAEEDFYSVLHEHLDDEPVAPALTEAAGSRR